MQTRSVATKDRYLLIALVLGVVAFIAIAFKLTSASVALSPAVVLHDNQLFLSEDNPNFIINNAPYSSDKRVVAIRSGQDLFVLQPNDLQSTPIFLSSALETSQFYQRQTQLFNFVVSDAEKTCHPCLFWQLSSGYTVPATIEMRSGLDHPPLFYFFMVMFFVSMVAAGLVWAVAVNRQAAYYFSLMGVSLALMGWAEGIYMSRGLALNGETFQFLVTVSVFAFVLFWTSFCGFLMVYPKVWWQTHELVIPLLALVISSLISFYGGSYVWLLGLLAIAGGFFLYGLQRQYQMSRADPLAFFRIKWWLLSLMVGLGIIVLVFVLAYFVPEWRGMENLYGLIGLFVMYLMMALSVTNLRLFEINNWWSHFWYFALMGFGAFFVVVLLVYYWELPLWLAVLLGMVLMSWMTLPFKKVVRLFSTFKSDMAVNSFVPALIGANLQSIEQEFKAILLRRFRPRWVKVFESDSDEIYIQDGGAEMLIPFLNRQQQYCLGFPENGQRLFTQEDLQWAQQVYEVAFSVRLSLKQRELGEVTERQRIRRDLHDEMTQEIISLMRYADTEEVRQKAQELMQSLKQVLSALSEESSTLGEVLTIAQSQMREKLMVQGLSLQWQETLVCSYCQLSQHQVSNLLKILRESTSNLLKYAKGSIVVNAYQSDTQLEILVENEISDMNEHFASNRLGLNNMKKRAEELGGYIQSHQVDGMFKLVIAIPMNLYGVRDV